MAERKPNTSLVGSKKVRPASRFLFITLLSGTVFISVALATGYLTGTYGADLYGAGGYGAALAHYLSGYGSNMYGSGGYGSPTSTSTMTQVTNTEIDNLTSSTTSDATSTPSLPPLETSTTTSTSTPA